MRFVQILDYFWNILNVNLPEINSLVTNAQYLQYNVILSLTEKKNQVCFLFQKGVHWENILFFLFRYHINFDQNWSAKSVSNTHYQAEENKIKMNKSKNPK